MKEFALRALILLFVTLALGAACASPSPTPTPTQTPLPSPTIAPTPTATPAPLVVTDDIGRTVEFSEIPQRVVSLAPSITETLFALGLGDGVVGVDDYSDYPPEVEAVPNVGSPFPGFSIETIVDLEPDLVLSVAGMIVNQLEEVGLTVMVLQPEDIEGTLKNIEMVGRLTGKEKEAEELVSSMRDRIEAVVARTAGAEKPRVFYEVDGTDPARPWTTGAETFQNELIDLAGGRNIAAERSGWFQMSQEAILDFEPQIIVLEDFQFGITPEDVGNRPGWDQIPAVSEGRVYPILDANLTSRPGPRIVEGLEELARLIHPDLFQ